MLEVLEQDLLRGRVQGRGLGVAQVGVKGGRGGFLEERKVKQGQKERKREGRMNVETFLEDLKLK